MKVDATLSPSGSTRGRRRAELVRVATEIFAKHAYDDIFMADIAKAAGVAHGTLFYHFKDKRGLYLEVLRGVMVQTIELNCSLPHERNRTQQFRGALRRQIEFRRDHPQSMLAMMRSAGQDPDVDAIFEQCRRAAAAFIQEQLGVVGEPSPQLRIAIRGFLGFVDEMTIAWLTHDGDLTIGELEEFAYNAMVNILKTTPGLRQEIGPVLDEFGADTGSALAE